MNEVSHKPLSPKASELMARLKAATTKRQNHPPIPAYEYRKSIVTFIDILGFRELVNNDQARVQEIGEILAEFGSISQGEVTDQDHPSGLCRAIRFSDSVVRVCPIDSHDKLGALHSELLSLVHIQGTLAAKGVFIRGGVTVGSVYCTQDQIFGPGMIRAFDLETNYANYPRIVIDPIVFAEYSNEPAMRGSSRDINRDVDDIDSLITLGDDFLPFVDYLRAMRTELNDQNDYISALETHKLYIVNSAKSFKDLNKAKHKYLWLAGYYNNTINNSIDSGIIDKSHRDTLTINISTLF